MRDIYLLIVDVVIGGGDADGNEVGDDDVSSRSSMISRGTFPLKMS
jgi:hypothetical protein